MNTTTPLIPNTFYSLGKVPFFSNNTSSPPLLYTYNKSKRDTSATYIERNTYSINTKHHNNLLSHSKSQHHLNEANTNVNNYLNPLYNYFPHNDTAEQPCKHTLNYSLEKSKLFVKEQALPSSKLKRGTEITKETFTNLKRSQSAINTFHPHKTKDNSNNNDNDSTFNFNKTTTLHSNYLYFKPNKENIKQNREINKPGRIGITVTSKGVPHWMNGISFRKANKIKRNVYDNNITSFCSKFQNWITLEPGQPRNKSLESQRYNYNKQKLLRPQFMAIGNANEKEYKDKTTKDKDKDILKLVQYKTFRDPLKMMWFVDRKNINNQERSVFSIGDYNHLVMFKNELERNEKGISKQPKQFLLE